MALENTETDLQVTKNDLRLACQRIQDLQNALEDDLDSGTDVPDDDRYNFYLILHTFVQKFLKYVVNIKIKDKLVIHLLILKIQNF